MPLIQMTGLSGAGKTTLALRVKELFNDSPFRIEIIDGDVYRKTLCKDLGFSKADRCENIRRLGAVAHSFAEDGNIAIISAINPYEEVRNELKEKYNAAIVWIKCDLDVLVKRDPKGLYRRAMLPDGHPDKLANLTGVNDEYDIPVSPDLVIDTTHEPEEESGRKLYRFICDLMIQHS